MAAITPGTGGTIQANTAEGQLQAIVTLIANFQRSEVNNPSQATAVSATHDQRAGTFSGSYDLPATLAIGSGGVIEITADPYLVGAPFQVGNGGTFQASSPEGYLLEVLMYLQTLEQSPVSNPPNPLPRNFITGTFNSDSSRYQGGFTLPCTVALDPANGNAIYSVVPYLL